VPTASRHRARSGRAGSFRCRSCSLDVPLRAPGTAHRNQGPTCLAHQCTGCGTLSLNRTVGDVQPLSHPPFPLELLGRQ
jgi:hypothetical protein